MGIKIKNLNKLDNDDEQIPIVVSIALWHWWKLCNPELI